MARTIVRNLSSASITLPPPWLRVLDAGKSGIIADTPANVLVTLGGAAKIQGLLSLTETLDTVTADLVPISAADLPANIVTKAKLAMFVSAVITGTGAPQNTAHGLGVVPAAVFIALVASPAAFAQATVAEGAHDATNVIATVATNWVYRIIAWA